MIEKVDWSQLEAYQGSKWRSFEELCYQIAKGRYGGRGRFTSVDDSGGGDGVEFYMTLPNGDQWGWQAKFYHPDIRLSVSNRKQSIEGSLKKACQTHTHLKKWILCTPSDFTPGEQDWFENTLCQSIPENMNVKLKHWGDSDFNDWLSEPRFSGKWHYFFGKLELSIEWFQAQFDKQMASVGEKFSSSLHTETLVDARIHALLGDEGFVRQITELIEKLTEELSNLEEAIDDLKRSTPSNIEWDEAEKSKVIGAAESLQDTLANVICQLEQAKDLLNEGRLPEVQATDWKSLYTQLQKALGSYRTVGVESGTSKIRYTGKKEDEDRVVREATWTVDAPESLIANLLDDFFHPAMQRYKLINQPDLNILGDAGIGKTHIACNICDERLRTGLPALFIRGIRFTSDRPIEEQLRSILDIQSSCNSWEDFLQALSAAAEAYHTRIPLIIDGLNESTHNGAFSNVWRLSLKGLVQEIAQTKNLVLITTCRTSYEKAIWEDEDPPNRVYAYGFDTEEVEQAVDKYFNEYKIKADLTDAPLTQFEHPIYLKIFCESQNRDRKVEKQIYVGEQTLFEVFEEYLNQCNRAVCNRLERHPNTSIVQPALNKMAEYLWQNRSRDIPLDELVHIVDNQSREQLDWWSSKTCAIVAEGLLVCQDWSEDKDVVYFTYDLFGGYLIAKYLIQQATDDGQGFLQRAVSRLFGEENRALHLLLNGLIKCLTKLLPSKMERFLHNFSGNKTLHPLYTDIGRCLATLLPSKMEQFLHDLSDNETAYSLSIRGLFEISYKNISEDCINLITRLFGNQQNREPLFKLAETTVGHTKHPFNASFWSEQLRALPMPERDLSWTEYVRHNVAALEKRLVRFEEACQSDQELSDTSKKRLHLLAEYIMWVLTSTRRPLRDKATRALYWYGRRFPQEFLDLVIESLSINDPYVSERMLAATYGTVMARQHDFQDDSFTKEILPVYGRQLYDTMFKPKAPHSTTHILARDYARRTIDTALIHHPDLLTADEKRYITPPFTEGGIRKWGESEDKNKGEYRDGNAPLGMDFENYTLGRLVKDRRNYDSEHDEYKRVRANIFWRIYDLGYSLDSFGEIDKGLARENFGYGRSADGRKTDRYGKKYSWIAFYELAGFRQDKGLLPEYYDTGRPLEADIDPSFPIKQREYNLVEENFLGDQKISTEEWVLKNDSPDVTPYLKIDRLCGEEGPWILLDGSLNQKDDQISREMFAFLQGLIVKPEESEKIVELLKKRKKINADILPWCPEDHSTYAGEIPWCDTYPANDWEELKLETGLVLVPEEQQFLLRNGRFLSDQELSEFWRSIVDLIESKDIGLELGGILGMGSIEDLVERDDWETIEAQLHERGFELTTKTVEVEQKEYQTFEVLYPVRGNNWSDSQSSAVPGRGVITLSRQIAETLDLCGQPQSFDLFEKNGRRASITFHRGEGWGETQKFTYLREDLLKRYLAEINGELIWVIWGERREVSQNRSAPYKSFQEVKVYRHS